MKHFQFFEPKKKQAKTPPSITFRVTPDFFAKLEKIAIDKGLGVGPCGRMLINERMDEIEQKKG
jgi:hypothetical protein